MPTKEDYRAKAHNCLDLAEHTTDQATANLLRMLAADYFSLAERSEKAAAQQQQQVQPKDLSGVSV
jgi:hypothetical protein